MIERMAEDSMTIITVGVTLFFLWPNVVILQEHANELAMAVQSVIG